MHSVSKRVDKYLGDQKNVDKFLEVKMGLTDDLGTYNEVDKCLWVKKVLINTYEVKECR